MVILHYLWFATILAICYCLPPRQRHEAEKPDSSENDVVSNLDSLGIEYTRYLQQVVEALEKDEYFKHKLEKAKPDEIQSAKIAEELEFVNHHVRSKLDELKRQELDRLKDLAKKMYPNQNDYYHTSSGHLDHENPNTFEIKDLKKLIRQAVDDLEEADKKRKEMFKSYELEKHFEREQKLKNMTEEDKSKFMHQEEESKKSEEEAKKKIHHPGSKQQLEEVWENQDHMSKNDFHPRTFFMMHDVDGNGFLDEDEIKTLFVKELDKLYASGSFQGDAVERAEELERMREHIFTEVDKNQDRLISWDEFYAMSLKADFNEDPGWQPLQEQEVYSPQEWHEYEQKRLAEEGRYPQQHFGQPDPNIHYGPDGHPQAYYQQPVQGAANPPQQQGIHQYQGVPQQGIPQHQGMPQQGVPQHQGMPQQGIPQQPVAQQQQPPVMYQNQVPVASQQQPSGQVPVVQQQVPVAPVQQQQQPPPQQQQPNMPQAAQPVVYQQQQPNLPHVAQPVVYQQQPQYGAPQQPGVYQQAAVPQQQQYAAPQQPQAQQNNVNYGGGYVQPAVPQQNNNNVNGQNSQYQNYNNQQNNVVDQNNGHKQAFEKKS